MNELYSNPFETGRERQEDAEYDRELAAKTACFPKADIQIGDHFLIDGEEVELLCKRVDGFAVMAVLSNGKEIYSADLTNKVAHGEWVKLERPAPTELLCVDVSKSVSLAGVFE